MVSITPLLAPVGLLINEDFDATPDVRSTAKSRAAFPATRPTNLFPALHTNPIHTDNSCTYQSCPKLQLRIDSTEVQRIPFYLARKSRNNGYNSI
jgi:hypothetical protein